MHHDIVITSILLLNISFVKELAVLHATPSITRGKKLLIVYRKTTNKKT